MIADYAEYADSEKLMVGFEQVVAGLVRAGKRLAIVFPVPTFPINVPYALGLLAARGSWPGSYLLARAEYNRKNGQVVADLERISIRFGARRIVPADVFCDVRQCRAFMDGASLYFDQMHMSVHGARELLHSREAAEAILPP